jgi:hypothetical protein
MANAWQKNTPGIFVLMNTLLDFHLRLTRIELAKKLQRTQSVMTAMTGVSKNE